MRPVSQSFGGFYRVVCSSGLDSYRLAIVDHYRDVVMIDALQCLIINDDLARGTLPLSPDVNSRRPEFRFLGVAEIYPPRVLNVRIVGLDQAVCSTLGSPISGIGSPRQQMQ